MNWISLSLLMFIASSFLYLVIRKASKLKIPTSINNLAMFGIPFFIYLGITQFLNISLFINAYTFFIIFFSAIVFSYLGNKMSLLAIERSPNPGYSLVISKSYVVFTTLIAVLFFNSVISAQKCIGIFLVIIFSALIMINKTGKKIKDYSWVVLSFGAFFCWGMLSISSKYLFNRGIDTFVYLTYLYLFVTTTILIESYYKKVLTKITKQQLLHFFAIGVLSTVFNLAMFLAIKYAPNVGFVNAINASSISLVTILSAIFFKDELNFKKSMGVGGVILGLLLLLI